MIQCNFWHEYYEKTVIIYIYLITLEIECKPSGAQATCAETGTSHTANWKKPKVIGIKSKLE